VPCGLMLAAMLGAISATERPTACQTDRLGARAPPVVRVDRPHRRHRGGRGHVPEDLADPRRRTSAPAERWSRPADQGVVGVATSFVDNSGISRVKSVPLDRLPQLAAWGVGFSTAFDYFRFDDWVAAPAPARGRSATSGSSPT
jgi:hypothetical protein